MNETLLKRVTRGKVETAMFQIGPFKAPEPDDFGACFYHKFWGTMGDDVVRVAFKFLEGGEMDEFEYFTYIALILKIKDIVSASDFRPISLCNVVNKIIAKTLVNRMKLVFGEVISNNQSAFLPESLILDNIILAYETLHSMKIIKNVKIGSMTIKVDMSKANDI